jgi:hypothetical protein
MALTLGLTLAPVAAVRAQGSGHLPPGDIGVKLGDTSTLHVGISAEGGYDSNVFYNDEGTAKEGAAMLRVTPSFRITNAARDGKPRSRVIYNLAANLVYREYFAQDQDVRAQRAFVPSAVASLTSSGEKVSLSLGDTFSRAEDPPYFKGGRPIIRLYNQGSGTVGISPGGGRITISLRYTNTVDHFETREYQFASNMTHDGMLDGSWKWLPKTAFYLQGGAAFVNFYNATSAQAGTTREDSVQVRGLAGLRGLVTPKTTVNLGAGYSTAFYETSSNPNGLSNVLFLLDVGYRPSLLSQMGLALRHGFQNSPIIGNYYDYDSANLYLNQSIAALVASISGTVEHRRYQNTPAPRQDLVFSAGVSLDYYIQKWFYAGASYVVSLNRPNEDALNLPMGAMGSGAVKYTKHQVVARLGIAY